MALSSLPKDKKRIIVWEWEEDHGHFLPYSPEVSNFLESARLKHATIVDLIDVCEYLCFYQVDLRAMCQISRTTGRQRKVRKEEYDPDTPPGRGVQWEWWADYDWAPYDLPTSCCIEKCYKSGKTAVDLSTAPVRIDNVVDFKDMSQINKYTNFKRKVRRVHLPDKYVSVKDAAQSVPIVNGLPQSSLPRRRIKRALSEGDEAHSNTKVGGTSTNNPVEKYGLDAGNPPDEDCCICLEKLNTSSSPGEAGGSSGSEKVKELKKCHHFFHAKCLRAMYDSGPKDGSLQCPTCKCIHGIKHGNQPNTGTMTVRKAHHSLPGYEGHNTINIVYNFHGGVQDASQPHPGQPFTARGFPRSCYLPDNQKGRKVLELLQVAWERKLIFTIGTSTTTGEADTVVWNEIHHKTSVHNHSGHGYPDPSYLDNVIQELSAHGVVEKSSS